MAKHEMSRGSSKETRTDLYQASYEGARVNWERLRYAAQYLHQSEGEYTLIDHHVAEEPFESTTVVVSSRNGKYNAMADIVLEPSEEYPNRTIDFIGRIDLIPSEILRSFGLTKSEGGENYIVFNGASGERLCLFVSSPLRITIYNTLVSSELQIEPPNLVDTNCLDAIEELTALWLIAMREAEKTIDYNYGMLSDLSFKVEPTKQANKEFERDEIHDEEDEGSENEEQPELKNLRKNIAPSDSEIKLSDIGGNSVAKKQLLDLVFSFKNGDVFTKWGVKRPNGILLHGPPGNGKTMLVTAFANEIDAELVIVQSTDFRDMWLGNSEKNLKQIFEVAQETEELSILFFDELDGIIQDSAFSGATRKSEAAIFKQEMTNLAKTKPNIIIMAATNDFDGINEALTRAGRFDIKIAVGMPTEQDRQEIFAIKISTIIENLEDGTFTPVSDDINVAELSQASEGMSGADITALIEGALYQKAIQEARTGTSEPLSQQDILRAIRNTRQQK